MTMPQAFAKYQTSVKLPDGWKWVHLQEVCQDTIENRNPCNNPEQPFTYVDISSIDAQLKQIIGPKQLLGKNAPSRARQVIRANDVIVSTTRPNLNAVAMVPFSLDNQICSTGFCVLRPNADLSPYYLFFFVRTANFVESLTNLVKGALYPAVTDGQVKSQLMPLPPTLAEQARIARILNEQMAAVEKARAAAEARLEAAQSLEAAYLRAVFNDGLLEKWPKQQIGKICSIIGGNTLPVLDNYYGAEKIFCLKVSDLKGPFSDGRCLNGGSYSVHPSTAGKRILEPGATVFPKRGGAIATNEKRLLNVRAVLDPNLMGIQPKEGSDLLPIYLYLWLQNLNIASLQSGNSVPQVNQQDFFPLPIPLPDVSTQQKYASALMRNILKAKEVVQLIQQELDSVNTLPAALLRQAFTGGL